MLFNIYASIAVFDTTENGRANQRRAGREGIVPRQVLVRQDGALLVRKLERELRRKRRKDAASRPALYG